jgi:phospholipid/cholesterol/gamma-HCH transport system substrate-binding protein/paraquat-inducible protein B
MILEKLEEINVKGITDGLEDTLSSMNKILDEVKMSKLTEQAGQLLAELRETNKEVKPLITDASETMDSVSEELPEILAQFKRTLRRFNNFVSNEEHNVAVSTENVRLITGNLRDMTENAKRYPSQFLFGSPPPRLYPGGKQQ